MLGLGSPISSDTTKGNLYKNGYCLAFDGTNDKVTIFSYNMDKFCLVMHFLLVKKVIYIKIYRFAIKA